MSMNSCNGRSTGRLGYLCVVASECSTQLARCLCELDLFIMRGIWVGFIVYMAYGIMVAIAELIIAALLLVFSGSVFNFDSR